MTLYESWRNTPNNQWPVGTMAELHAFQRHLKNLGIVDTVEEACNRGYPEVQDKPYLSVVATLLGINEVVIDSIIHVESNGDAFDETGQMILRFELHEFLRTLTDIEEGYAKEHFRLVPGLATWNGKAHEIKNETGHWIKIHTGNQKDERFALATAIGISKYKAWSATSMGMFQILGANYKNLFYRSPVEMAFAFRTSVIVQVWGFVSFLISHKDAIPAIQRGDYEAFARIYNGPGQAKDYAHLLELDMQRK